MDSFSRKVEEVWRHGESHAFTMTLSAVANPAVIIKPSGGIVG